mgnify:CR=1 FL=1
MPKTTNKNEKLALAKKRRKVHKKLVAKQKARSDSKKGLGIKESTHPHRSSPARGKRIGK